MVRVLALLVVMCACGRFGFETPQVGPGDPDAPGSGDGGATTDALIAVVQDMCPTSVPALAAAPTIDGVLEAGLTLTSVTTPVWEPDISGAVLPSTFATSWVVAWRPDGLYFFVDVTDPDRWPAANQDDPYCGDGVELYVDSDGVFAAPPLYDAAGTRQLISVAPSTDITAVTSGKQFADHNPAGNWQTGFVATSKPR